MSGRLIILPKKSYCPWNPQNVERVLRDEREHAEAQERETAERDRETSRSRRKALEAQKASRSPLELSASNVSKHPQHINLFAKEEEEHRRRAENAAGGEADGKTKHSGVAPLYLGQSARTDSFYLSGKDRYGLEAKSGDEQDSRLKDRQDPMKDFCKYVRPKNDTNHAEPSTKRGSDISPSSSDDDSSHEQRQRRKRRRARKEREKSERKSKRKSREGQADSIDELRKRRAEREEQERERQGLLMRRRKPSPHYQDQYNPRFSRN